MSKKKVLDDLAKNVKTMSTLKKNYIARFFCYQKNYHFSLPILDENGKQTYITDANGNNRQPQYKKYEFSPMPVIDELSKKIKADEFESFFDVTEDMEQKEQLIKYLEDKAKKSTATKIVSEEEYIKRKNPVAYDVSIKHDAEIEARDKKIAELEAQLKSRK